MRLVDEHSNVSINAPKDQSRPFRLIGKNSHKDSNFSLQFQITNEVYVG